MSSLCRQAPALLLDNAKIMQINQFAYNKLLN